MPHHITHTHYTCIFIQAIHTERHTSITVSFIPFFTPLHKELTTIKKITFCHEGKWERWPNCIQPSTPESRLQLTRKLVLQTHTHNRYRKFNFNYLFQTDLTLTCGTWISLKILQMRPLQNSFMAARWKKASEKLRGFIWPVHFCFFE